MIDYFLRDATSGAVTLEILDGEGRLVRRFSSEDKPDSPETVAKEIPAPTYWVRPQQILSAEAGMHRFVWDLHYAPPDALEHEYPISAIIHDTPKHPLGAWALPGQYTLELTVDGKKYYEELEVKMDPRIQTSLEGLKKQFDMQMGAVQGMNETFAALKGVRALRARLKERAAKAGQGSAAAAMAVLDQRAAELEGAPREAFLGLPPSGKEPENLSTLHQHFARLLAVADSADAAPTSQARAVYDELQAALKTLLTQWEQLKKDDLPQ
jgi:hypothetical protein